MHLRRLENICEKKEQRLSCNEILPDPFANGIVRIDSEQALTLLSAENTITRALVAITQLTVYYASQANDMPAAVKCGHQVILLSQAIGEPAYTINIMS